MRPSVIVWDLETVPDLGGFAAANDLVGKSDVEVCRAVSLASASARLDRSGAVARTATVRAWPIPSSSTTATLPRTCRPRSSRERRAPALWWGGEVQLPEHGSKAISPGPDSRISAAVFSAQLMQTPARSIPQPAQLQLDL
jgi:hypothetical protein